VKERGQHCRRSGRLLFATACVLLWLAPSALAGDADSQAPLDEWTITHFEQAREAQKASRFPTAVAEYRLIVSRRPDFAEAWLNLGIVYQQQSNYTEAIKVFKQALSLKPGMLQAQVLLGMSLCLTQEYRAALKPLDQALAQNPKERQAGIYRALARSGLEEPEGAAEQLRRTLAYYPEDPEILYQLGEAYNEGIRHSGDLLYRSSRDSALYQWAMALSAEAKNDAHGAIRHYLAALTLDPVIPQIYSRLVVLLREIGMPDLSRNVEQRLTRMNPPRPFIEQIRQMQTASISAFIAPPDEQKTYVSLWDKVPRQDTPTGLPLLADSSVNHALKELFAKDDAGPLRDAVRLFELGKVPEAAAELRGGMPQSKSWLAPYLLARCYLFQSDADAAEAVLETVLAPSLEIPSVALLKLEIQSELAVRSYSIVMQSHPDSYRAHMLKARTLGANGRVDEAVREYREVLHAMPLLPQVHLAIAQLYSEQSNWEDAIKELNQELAISPNNALALALLGRGYVQTGNEGQAIPVLRRVIHQYPDDAYALGDLGKALAAKGQTKEAIEKLEAAVARDSSQYRLHYRLFELYRLTGQQELAQQHLAIFRTEDARRRTRGPALE